MLTFANQLGFPPLLTIMLFLPAAGGVALVALPFGRESDDRGSWSSVKSFAMVIAAATFALSVFLLVKFQEIPTSYCRSAGTCHLSPAAFAWPVQFSEHGTWFPSLGISYFLGMDGINVWLTVLCTGVMMLAIFAACMMINRNLKGFLVLMLIAETGMLGVFLSWNLFLFYIFWEVMLVPAYFLVGMWGEKKRIYATTKFVIYTIFGSFLMLVGIFYLWATVPGHNLDFRNLMLESAGQRSSVMGLSCLHAGPWNQGRVVPVPFSWAPDAYVEAPDPCHRSYRRRHGQNRYLRHAALGVADHAPRCATSSRA